MPHCEDFPCCGHESGCCPDFDESGKQLNMKCICGAAVPIGRKISICDNCLKADDEYEDDDDFEDEEDDDFEDEDDDFDEELDF